MGRVNRQSLHASIYLTLWSLSLAYEYLAFVCHLSEKCAEYSFGTS